MNWTCEQIEERLSEYLDRLLTPAERAGFAAHAEGCAVCRPLVARVGALVEELHRLAPAEPPPALVPRILERTPQARGWLRRLPAWLRPVAQPRFAVGMATAALALLFVLQGMGVQVKEISLQDLHPRNIYNAADRQAHLLYARGAKFVSDLRVVYEIQSRLPQTPESERPAESPREDDSSDREPDRSRPQNRADEVPLNLPLLAQLALPGRSY